LQGLSGACKTPVTGGILMMVLFSTFQDIHSGCFTVDAHEMGHLFGLTELVRDVCAG
jgi:hypothetical protein